MKNDGKRNGKLPRRLAALAALAILLLPLACQKAGDGVGLDREGQIRVAVDTCAADPARKGCPQDPCVLDPASQACAAAVCKLDPTAPGCTVDVCKANPSAPGCTVDVCQANPSAPGCPGAIDCSTLPKKVECLDRAYFTANVLPVFKAKCEECHKRNGQAWTLTKLSLEPDMAWDSLVNIPSIEMPTIKKSMMRVRPGMPDSSYLYVKITSARPPVGAQMPAAGSKLSDSEIEKIRNWIIGKP